MAYVDVSVQFLHGVENNVLVGVDVPQCRADIRVPTDLHDDVGLNAHVSQDGGCAGVQWFLTAISSAAMITPL